MWKGYKAALGEGYVPEGAVDGEFYAEGVLMSSFLYGKNVI